MKYFKWLGIIFLAVALVGCVTTDKKPTPTEEPLPISATFKFKVRTIETNYSFAKKEKVDEKLCYRTIEITWLPLVGVQSAWRNAGVDVGDHLVLFEKDLSGMEVSPNLDVVLGGLFCNNDPEAVKKWFIGKVKYEIYTENGFVMERVRFLNPGKDNTFEVKVVRVKFEE